MKKKNPDSENEKRARIKKEASDWVVKQSFDYSPEDQDAFFEWLAADPQHAGAYASHQEAWKRASILADWRPAHSLKPNPDLLDPIRKAFRADGFRFSATGGPAYGWQASGFRLPTLPMSRY